MAKAPAARIRPALSLSVAVEAAGWPRRLPAAPALCRRWARAAMTAAVGRGAPRARYGCALVLGDDALLHRLNRQFRGQDKPTNVLSFPAEAVQAPLKFRNTEMISLGDIAIAWETTAAEARSQGKSLADHLAHLTVHGVLHLFGYDHQDERQAEEMEALERAVLARFGIADPYVIRSPRKTAAGRTARSRSGPVRRPAATRT